MTATRAVGRRVRRLGRARRLLRHRPGSERPGACCGSRRRTCGAGPTPGSRSACTSSRAWSARCAGSRPAARQREALVALGTLAAGLAHEINNPASAATRAVDALESTSESLLSVAGQPRGGGDHRGPVRRAGRPAQARSNPRRHGARPAGAGRPRGELVRLARRRTASTGLVDRARAGRRRGRRRLVRAGRRSPRDAAARCRPRVGGQLAVDRRAARRGQGRRPGGSPTWSRRCGRTPSSTGPRCRRPTSPRGSTAPS